MNTWQIWLFNFGSQAFPFSCGVAICYLVIKIRELKEEARIVRESKK